MKLKRISYIIFLIGLSIFMYPHAMKIMFELQSESQISEYDNIMEHMTDEEIRIYLEEVEAYNEYIANEPAERISDPFTPITERSETASVTNESVSSSVRVQPRNVISSGPFAYIDIPRISQKLPIYLGATNDNLAKGVAQLDRTSLPVGGVGTHSVIAGHRGFNRSVPFFKYLDQLVPGDRFYIHVMNRTLTYEVYATEVILPDEREKLKIDPEKDLVTLLTCEPYRVNTHRLLVYGIRVGGEEALGKGEDINDIRRQGVLSVNYAQEAAVSNEARIDRAVSYIVVGAGSVLWFITLLLFIRTFRKKPKA